MPISPEISPYRAQLESGQWFRLLPGELQEQLLGEGRLLPALAVWLGVGSEEKVREAKLAHS